MQDTSTRRPGLLSRLLGGSASASEPVRTVRVALNAYGKLPIYKDFISAGLTDPGAREFRNWIDRGFSHRWSSEDALKETSIPRHLFLLRLPESGSFVTGCLWGSEDEGGLRRFPFTIFACLPEGHAAAEPLTAAEHLDVLDRQADRIVSGFGRGGSLAQFYRTYRGAEMDLPARQPRRVTRETRAELERIPTAAFAASLFGERSGEAWPGFLARLRAAGEGKAGETAGAVRLRLSGSLSRSRELQFWLLYFAAVHRRRPVTGMLFPADPSGSRVTFFFRDLRAEDFLLLHPTRGDYAFAEDLSGAPVAAAAAPASSAGTPSPDFHRPLSALLET
jgi:type VI secretion system ImpM family protein